MVEIVQQSVASSSTDNLVEGALEQQQSSKIAAVFRSAAARAVAFLEAFLDVSF